VRWSDSATYAGRLQGANFRFTDHIARKFDVATRPSVMQVTQTVSAGDGCGMLAIIGIAGGLRGEMYLRPEARA